MGRPLNKKNFGTPEGGDQIKVQFNNGTASVAGWIEEQIASRRFKCTDGTNSTECRLTDKQARTVKNESGNTIFYRGSNRQADFNSSNLTITANDIIRIGNVELKPNDNFGQSGAVASGRFNVTTNTGSRDRRIHFFATSNAANPAVSGASNGVAADNVEVIQSADLEANEMSLTVRDFSADRITLTGDGTSSRGRPTGETGSLVDAIIFVNDVERTDNVSSTAATTTFTAPLIADTDTVEAVIPVVRQVTKISGRTMTLDNDSKVPWGYDVKEGFAEIEEAGTDSDFTDGDDFEEDEA